MHGGDTKLIAPPFSDLSYTEGKQSLQNQNRVSFFVFMRIFFGLPYIEFVVEVFFDSQFIMWQCRTQRTTTQIQMGARVHNNPKGIRRNINNCA